MSNTAIVVGGTRRIGRWVSEALLVNGREVHALYQGDDEAAELCRVELAQSGYALHTYRADAADAASLTGVIDGVARADGLGLLVNCAGLAASGPLLDTGPDDLLRLYESNVATVHNAVRATVPHMLESGGRIINFLSIGADTQRAFRHVPAYAAAKAMLASYSRSLARELAPHGITVNCIALGIAEVAPEDVPGTRAEQLPAGRAVNQEDIAAAVWYLAGPSAEQVTGTVLNVSGGCAL
jgi:NAD(P)-dependent dehydrogenase (short-subunit alcohol dehydrogenase family)